MKKPTRFYLGFDLGASSGRAVLGSLKDKRLKIEEINRFVNAPSKLGNTWHWNFLSLWANLMESLRICGQMTGGRIASIGVDTWGVDFGLLGADGKLVGNPTCYRDSSMDGVERVIASTVGLEKLYRLTGQLPSRITTLTQLVTLARDPSASRLKFAKTLLMMPDLFRYFLCGHKAIELTAAGSSQLVNIRTGKWCPELFRKMGLPMGIMPEIVKPAIITGKLQKDIASQTGLNQALVVAVAGHDTTSAAAAAPFADESCAFISCGTWSLIGVVNEQPITTAQALKKGFVNAFGLDSILFIKAMMGLYLFENLRRAVFKKGLKLSYSQMIRDASRAAPFGCMLNPDAPLFFASEDPELSAKKFLSRTGQKAAPARGQVIRALFEALAFNFRAALNDLEKVTGRKLKRVCLVGGGSRNRMLCQMVADATDLNVIAGPAEATGAGNVAMQALATGELKKAPEIRDLIRNSFKLATYQPKPKESWDKHFDRYLEIMNKSGNIG